MPKASRRTPLKTGFRFLLFFVSVLRMEVLVHATGGACVHTLERGELLLASRGNRLERAECLQKGGAANISDVRNVLESASIAFGTKISVVSYGEAVGFVADTL